MKLSLTELQIIERLLLNRLNAAYDPKVEELLCKVRKEINTKQKSCENKCKVI
ncbi:MAG: hypothetical protein HFH68_17095 [Lachnospiraceae bacterium]|nr:hypothetical protein [Lachnospiraceae bacterium]